MADRDDDIPLTDDELALAQRGSVLIAAAMAHPEARAPQALRDALERADTAAAAPATPAATRRSPGSGSARSRPRRWLIAPGLGFACVVILAFMLVLSGHGAGADRPSVLDVAAVTRLPARQGAPSKVAGGLPRLSVTVEGIAFPDWSAEFHWKTTGRRTDRVGGRAVTTVFYRYQDGTMLGYAIVAGAPLRWPAGRDVVRRGVRYRILTRAGRTTVTWTEAGHTCVLDAASRVPAAELVALADWANA